MPPRKSKTCRYSGRSMSKRETERAVREKLFALRDEKYGEFQRKLIPTVKAGNIIGVRTPELRKLARTMSGTRGGEEFLACLPHRYFEENNLHGFLIERMRGFEQALAAADRFLPYVDNWATCDQMSPKIFAENLPELCEYIKRWTASGKTYTVRFGIEMLMGFYLGDAFSPEYPELVAGVRSEEYYVNMMRAWYFATALAKRWDDVLPYVSERRLDVWTHNRTIQKAIESYRITDAQKAYLRELRIK
jgi:3-methyladenine DNA glycosylase AlkD